MLYLDSIFPFGIFKGTTVRDIIYNSSSGVTFIKTLLPNLEFAQEVHDCVKMLLADIEEAKKEYNKLKDVPKRTPSPAKGVVDELKAKEKLKEAEDRMLSNTSYQDLYSFLDTINVSYNNE